MAKAKIRSHYFLTVIVATILCLSCSNKTTSAPAATGPVVDQFLVAVAFNPSSIVVWKMKDDVTVDVSSQQVMNFTDFTNNASFTDGFFGLAYSANKLYVSGRVQRVYKVNFDLDSNHNAVLGTTLNANGILSGTENGSNTYYLNNNIFNNVLFAGRIDEGIEYFNLSDWTASGVSYYDNGTDGAKSACMIGGKTFLAGDNLQGIRRLDDASGANLTSYLFANNPGVESITTDGTYLYGNDDVSRGVIRKYLPGGTGTTLTLADQNGTTWNNPDISGRIRGISYSDNGYLYVSAGGNAGYADRALYAINATTGVPTAINATVPGTGIIYGAIRIAIPRP